MSGMRLDDEVIGQIARLLQLALLTGTDIVDNLRMIRVTLDESSGSLILSDEYKGLAEAQLEQLVSEIETSQTQNTQPPDIEVE